MAGFFIPGSRRGYRSTTAALKWIVLIAVLGTLLFLYVFRKAVKDTDEMYKQSVERSAAESELLTKTPK